MAGQIGPYASPLAFFGLLDNQEQKETVLKDVAKEAAARFKSYREAISEAVALRDLKASDRLRIYTQRAPEIWARLQSQFPQEYHNQQQDWYYLQRKIALAPHPEGSKALFEKNATSPLPTAFVPNGGLGA